MLAYAANRPSPDARRSSPQAMLIIAVVHVAAIAAVMSAKMDLPQEIGEVITRVEFIDPVEPPPPPPPPQQQAVPKPSPSVIDNMPVIVPVPQPDANPVDTNPVPLPSIGDVVGPNVEPVPNADPLPREIVRTGPRFATPDHLLRPPYPASKLDSGEEAALKLRLTIDERGRVIGVEPVGRADPVFLAAARRHLTARWRYKPATEDGRAVASSTVITLRFELE